jgi:hypothetical protein
MLTAFLKITGIGLVAAGSQDCFLDDAPNSSYYNSAITVVGFFSWALGTVIERRQNARAIDEASRTPWIPRNSTELIKTSLKYSIGVGVVTGVTHLAKQVGTNSAAIGMATGALIFPVAIQELSRAEMFSGTKLKWEKLRFALLNIGDYLTGSSMKKIFNGVPLDIFSIVSLPLGLALSLGEAVYTYKNDVKPQLESAGALAITSALNKRVLKLNIGLGTLFILQSLLMGETDKYSIDSDVYIMVTNIFLFMALMKIRDLSRTSNNQQQLFIGTPPRVVLRVASPAPVPELLDLEMVNDSTQKYLRLNS